MPKYIATIGEIFGGVYLNDLDGKPLPYEDAVKIVERLAKRYPSYNYVYVLHSKTTDLYKVGFTSHTAEKRCAEVRTEMKDDTIDVINSFRYVPSEAGKVEKFLHVILSPYNINGEWFDLPDVYVDLFRSTTASLPWQPYNSRLLYEILFTWLHHEIEHNKIEKHRRIAWLKMARSLVPIRRGQLKLCDIPSDEQWSKWEQWMSDAMKIIYKVEKGHYDRT